MKHELPYVPQGIHGGVPYSGRTRGGRVINDPLVQFAGSPVPIGTEVQGGVVSGYLTLGDAANFLSLVPDPSQFERAIVAINQTGQPAAHQTVTLIGATSPYKTNWQAPEDLYLVACIGFAGCAVSLNGGYTNFATIQNVSGVYPDMLFYFPSNSGIHGVVGNIQIPVDRGVNVYLYMNVAGSIQLFWVPR